jgi:Flp pilus assembly protein TadD
MDVRMKSIVAFLFNQVHTVTFSANLAKRSSLIHGREIALESDLCMHLVVALACGLILAGPSQASGQSLESRLQAAVAAQQAGDSASAIRLYKEVLRERPNWGEVRSNLGAALVHEGRLSEAIEEYKVALKTLPGNTAVALNLALAHYKFGDYKEAAELLAPIQPQQPANLQIAELLANCWNQLNQTTKVITLLTPLHQANPKDRAVAFQLGTALLNQGRTTEAETLLDGIFRNGESAEAQMLLGAGKLRAREFNAAVNDLRRAVELNPNLPQVHAYYGRALKAVGSTPQAEAEFRVELARNPYDFMANLELGLLLKQDGHLDEASKCLDAALRVRPNDPGALYQQATLDVLRGNNEKARMELERLTKENPTFTEAFVSLATTYYRLKRREDGDRIRLIVRQLQEEEQARQSGVKAAENEHPSSTERK